MGVIVDVETTDFDHAKDEIIELRVVSSAMATMEIVAGARQFQRAAAT